MKYHINYIVIVILVLIFLPMLVCAVDFMYWDVAGFSPDPIALANITNQAQTQQGSSVITLFTNGDAEISADNAVSGPAELSCATDELVTEYMLAFDGNGSAATGGTDTSYETYDAFLATPAAVTWVADDNDVEVTLWVRASNNAGEAADADTYNAIQTLTVSWTGP